MIRTLITLSQGQRFWIDTNTEELAYGNTRIDGPGKVSATGEDGQVNSWAWDRLIIATGSQPFSVPDFPFDDRLHTNVPGVFAIGDVLGPERVMLAHVASTEAMLAAENVMGADRAMDYTAVPGAIFTMPEVACVGLSEAQANAQGSDFRTDVVQFRTIGKAQVIGELAGQSANISDLSGLGRKMLFLDGHYSAINTSATLAVATPSHCRRPSRSRNTSQASMMVEAG